MSRAISVMVQSEKDFSIVKENLEALFPVEFHSYKDCANKFQFRVLESDFFLRIDKDLEDSDGLSLSMYAVHVDIYQNSLRYSDEYLAMHRALAIYVGKRLSEKVSSSVLVVDNLQIKLASFND
ncbi:MAG TPA: hypothetical protein VE954_08520 [Oligoflexus sp.]|uniref:hypothetical protein n=1 Tax=Oligoflexus sp. TaxID=1971216 RepID=UPI002D59CD10|nr:hypothetical protein [Oligoflexus sp.]HYX33147.1 hypothetical protein [Oligoflexus sp.]